MTIHALKYKEVGECWEAQHVRNELGYALIGKNRAHRLVYFWCNPDVSKIYIVRHLCNNPPCIRPEHLIHGTLKDNSQDMVKSGRHVPRKTLLDGSEIEEIIAFHELGLTNREISKITGISYSHIGRIIRKEVTING